MQPQEFSTAASDQSVVFLRHSKDPDGIVHLQFARATALPAVQLTRADDNCVGVVTDSRLMRIEVTRVPEARRDALSVAGVAVTDIERPGEVVMGSSPAV